MTTLLLQGLALAWALWLPGVLLAWLAEPRWSWGYRLAVGFAVGGLTVPLASFSAAWLLATSVTPAVVVGTGTALNAASGALLWWKGRRAHGG